MASPANAGAADAVERAPPAQGRRGRKPRERIADASPALPLEAALAMAAAGSIPGADGRKPAGEGGEALTAEMKFPVSDAAASGTGVAEHGEGARAGDAGPPSSFLGTPSPAQPAAGWDHALDTVSFDWPEIERTAAQDGPNRAMAKLLVAARAAGANSRWPL